MRTGCRKWVLQSLHLLLSLLLCQLRPSHQYSARLVYTLLGDDLKFQPYIWLSMHQARLFNPHVPLHLVLNSEALSRDAEMRKNAAMLRFTMHVYDAQTAGGVHTDFARHFFVAGKMTPDGNKQFNLFTTQRLYALHWFMASTNYTDVFHLENDNLLYVNVQRLVPHMHACAVSLGWPYEAPNQGIASFVYIRAKDDLLDLLQFINKVFGMSKREAIAFIGDDFINDMTLLAKYAADRADFNTGIKRLPDTLTWAPGSNCIFDRERLLFDSTTIGQWFTGTWKDPGVPAWWPSRMFDPRNCSLEWRDSMAGVQGLYVCGTKLVNLHVHSKRLDLYLSPSNAQPVQHG